MSVICRFVKVTPRHNLAKYYKQTLNKESTTCNNELVAQTGFGKQWNDVTLKYLQRFTSSSVRIDKHQQLPLRQWTQRRNVCQ